VHGFTVGPTPNPEVPSDLFNNILFSKYDFPVLYRPATVITPIGYGICFMISTASSLMT
jgi:hypothetical protein